MVRTLSVPALLKTCALEKDLHRGTKIHEEIERCGLLHKDVYIASALVNMYAKCASLAKAHQVFDVLPIQNVVSWNALITGYAHNGLGDTALSCYEQMQHEGISADAVTYTCILKVCSTQQAIYKGEKVHTDIERLGFSKNAVIGNALVDMYAKCGLLLEAQQVFDNISTRDIITWGALIGGYAQYGLGEQALKCFEQMEHDCINPDAVTFICILKVCANAGLAHKGQEVHAMIAREGLIEKHISLSSALIDMYAKCGLLAKAQDVFNCLPVHNVVSWSALAAGYAHYGLGKEAVFCFEQMQVEGIYPDVVIYVCILRACASMVAADKGYELHAGIVARGLVGEIDIAIALVDMYAKCNVIEDAQELLYELPVCSAVAWGSLLAGCVQHGHNEKALICFEQMQNEGVPPDPVVLVCTLKACGCIGAADMGQKIHFMIIRDQMLEKDDFIGTALVGMYSKVGLFPEAQEVFDELPCRCVYSWSALISGYCQHELGKEALICFEQMQQEGLCPDTVTIICALKACGSLQASEMGRQIQGAFVRDVLLQNDTAVGNVLVDMYVKCGLFREAQNIADKLLVRNVVLWSAMIGGYVEHCYFEEALFCFEQMQLEAIYPNAVTYVYILKACGNIGAIEMGEDLHAEVTREGWLEKDVVICTAVVNMYSSWGLLEKAQKVFDRLPTRDTSTWSALIAAYSQHGYGEKALDCFEQMQMVGIVPDVTVYMSILKSCGSLQDIDKGQSLHAEILKEGLLEKNALLGNALMGMYTKCGWLVKAQEVFEDLLDRNTVSWSVLIGGFIEHGYIEESLELYEQMQLEDLSPNAAIYICVLKACGITGAADKGKQLHAEIVMEELLCKEIYIGNALVDMYAKCGLVMKAQEVFNGLRVRDVVSWNSLMTGYALLGKADEAFCLFGQMIENEIKPELITFTVLLNACSHGGLLEQGEMCFSTMHAVYDIIPTLEHHACMIDLYSRSGYVDGVKSVIKDMPWCASLPVWHIVLGGCRQWGNAQFAKLAFQYATQLDEKDAATYDLSRCWQLIDENDAVIGV